MASTCSDKPTPMTTEQCDCRRRTTRRWLSTIGVVVMGISAVYVVPAISAGYKAQNTIDAHISLQEEFEKRLDERFDTIEQKFETSWDHENKAAKSLEKITDDLQDIRDIVIQSGLRPQPDSTP